MFDPVIWMVTTSATSLPAWEAGAERYDSRGSPTTSPCGPEAARANLSARQAKGRGFLTSATSGPLGSGSFSSGVLAESLGSRLRASMDTGGSTLFKLTWKMWTTPAGRRFSLLRASKLRTNDTESFSWPTPTARVSRSEKSSPEFNARRMAHTRGKTLSHVVTIYPTPTANRWGGLQSHGVNVVTGLLNPAWVAALMGYPPEWIEAAPAEPMKICKTCGTELTRKRMNGRLEDNGVFNRRKFCSLSCANTRETVTKHGYSYRARKHLKALCEACQTKSDLEAHHIDQNRANNHPSNIQTLCSQCHDFWHATCKRLGRTVAGRMACLVPPTESKTEWISCAPSATPSSRRSPPRSSVRRSTRESRRRLFFM
jgi:hypothetical protein